jgi:hypothetical protein
VKPDLQKLLEKVEKIGSTLQEVVLCNICGAQQFFPLGTLQSNVRRANKWKTVGHYYISDLMVEHNYRLCPTGWSMRVKNRSSEIHYICVLCKKHLGY